MVKTEISEIEIFWKLILSSVIVLTLFRRHKYHLETYRPGGLNVEILEEGRMGGTDHGFRCKFVDVGASGGGYATTQWRGVPFK